MSTGLFTQSISFEYVLIQQQKTWDEAQDYCRQNHIGNLVTVKSTEDWEKVQRAVQPALTSAVWTGLYNDISSWRWSYQDENLTFSTWYPGEPNNNDGKQECGFMINQKFNDMSCNKVYPFFCYNGEQCCIHNVYVIKGWVFQFLIAAVDV
ncbi:MAG: lectin-like protein [Plesiomonas shigelloides]